MGNCYQFTTHQYTVYVVGEQIKSFLHVVYIQANFFLLQTQSSKTSKNTRKKKKIEREQRTKVFFFNDIEG